MKIIDNIGSDLIPYSNSIAWINGADKYCYLKNDQIEQISKNEYMEVYAGKNWDKINKTLRSNGLGTSCRLNSWGELFSIHYQNGKLNHWNKDGELIETTELGELFSYGHAIYDIEIQEPNFLWLAFPTGQTVTQFDLKSKKETFRIGEYTFEEKYEPLSYPESLFSDHKHLYIPCMGTGDIYKLDLESKELKLYRTTKKPLWAFVKCPNGEFAQIEDKVVKLD